MPTNTTSSPKRKTLPKPSVFKHAATGNWVCEYYEFDEKGQRKARRKSFVRDLKKQGKAATPAEQRTAALEMEKALLKKSDEQERLERRERDQIHLTPKQLREAKAAFAIFDQIPHRKKSLVDAVIQYRDNLRVADDTPHFADAVAIFLARKQEATKHGRRSLRTYQTLKQRLSHLSRYMDKHFPNIRIGEITSEHLIAYFGSLEVSERTLRNYFIDISGFFNDASDSKDERRFINTNPMGGVQVHFKKQHQGTVVQSKIIGRKAPKILQLEVSKKALQLAWNERKHGVLGFVVCGLFLGMRPSEIFDLTKQSDHWQRFVKLEEGILRVDGFGKKRDQRTIVMPENAKAWLNYLQENAYPLCFKVDSKGLNTRYMHFRARAYLPEGDGERLVALRRKTFRGESLTDEEQVFAQAARKMLIPYEDVLRHTFGSNYYYANDFNKNKTIEQMGHSSEVFIEHYRGLLDSPKDAKKYFELVPEMFVA